MNKIAKQLYDALKTVPPDFDWEGEDDWEKWKVQRAEALKSFELVHPFNPDLPAGWRFLEDREVVKDGDKFWAHPGQWEPIAEAEGHGVEIFRTGFRPVIRSKI
jgi:hypothetical protein